MKTLLGLTLAIAIIATGCGGGGAGSGTNSGNAPGLGSGGSQSAPSVTGNTLAVSSPANNATVPSAVPFTATAASPSGISGMVINVDSKDVFSTYSARINTTVGLGLGAHAVIVKAWDNKGNYFAKPLNIKVRADGRTQWLQTPFEAGVGHAGGAYGFQNNNFLIEGAQRIASLGSRSIFVYLDPDFRTKYPDRADHQWPGSDPATATELAKTAAYKKVFGMNFRTIVLTVNSFANRDNLNAFINDPNAAAAEEQEFYDLAMYLYSHYAGTGKTFILKNWEGDWFTLGSMNPAATTSPQMLNALTLMCQARQRGVARARKDSGSP